MSRNDETASGAERDEPTTDSVYDFLYQDVRRIASFLGQMDPSGHLTSLKQTESAETGSGMKSAANVSGGVVVARGGASFEDQRNAVEREGLERTYDPLWANALTFLDMLDERGMIQRAVQSARIGQFVLIRGSLMLLDMGAMKAAWDIPAVKKAVLNGMNNPANTTNAGQSGVSPSNRKQRRAAQQQTALDNTELLFAMLKLMPHPIQARLLSSEADVWCCLNDDAIVGRASDLMLKHGVLIAGEWSMVGVLDAFPFDPDATTDNGQPIVEMLAAVTGTQVGQLVANLAPLARSLLGRPPGSFGVTPLLIFREISG